MSRIDEMIAEHCPNGVEFRRLGDVCTVFSGFAFKSALFNEDGVGMPLIRIRDVNTGDSGTYYSGDYDARYLVGNGHLLIGMDGDFQPTRWSRGRALLNQRVCRVQDFAKDVDPGFLYHLFKIVLRRIQEGTQAVHGEALVHEATPSDENPHSPRCGSVPDSQVAPESCWGSDFKVCGVSAGSVQRLRV